MGLKSSKKLCMFSGDMVYPRPRGNVKRFFVKPKVGPPDLMCTTPPLVPLTGQGGGSRICRDFRGHGSEKSVFYPDLMLDPAPKNTISLDKAAATRRCYDSRRPLLREALFTLVS